MDAELLLKWWPVLGVVIQGVFLWLAWSMRKMFVTKDELKAFQEELTERLCDHGQKIDHIESGLKTIPGGREFQELSCKINTAVGDIKAIGIAVEGMRELAARGDRQLNMLLRAHMPEEGRS
ncbi:MAG: DUF2730 family protein [Magnetococcales bacterium]|nr:DUF2730 family protein [Magnetococcales bacterium]